jgi:hypothetical protein
MSASEGLVTQQAGFKCTTNAPGKYYFVQLDTSECDANNIVIERAGAGGKIFGITYETTAAANRNCGINLGGVCYLVTDGSSAAITAGDYLKSDANGKGVKTTTDTDEVGAVALAGSSADGTIILVEIRKMMYAG